MSLKNSNIFLSDPLILKNVLNSQKKNRLINLFSAFSSLQKTDKTYPPPLKKTPLIHFE